MPALGRLTNHSLLFLFCLPLVFAGCDGKTESRKPPEAVHVEATSVKVAPLDRELNAVGSLASPQETLVSPQIAGRVVYLNINQGDVVSQGEVLARLDDAVEKAAVSAAEAALANARQIFKRDKRVADTGAVAEQKLESDRAAVQQAEAQLDQARANLDHTVIRAPFKGALGMRQVSLGAYLSEGQAIVQIQQLDPLYLDIYIPQQDVEKIKVGQTVRFEAAGLSEEFKGNVTALNPSLATGSRKVHVQATVSNPENKLRPGMFVLAKLIVGTIPNALFVPIQAIVPEGQVRNVWVVGHDDQAEKKTVVVGAYEENWVQIVSGLDPSDRVITAGTQKIYAGAKLKVSPYQAIQNPRLELANPEETARP